MRRKVTAETGAFTAFWQFLTYWAFEYLDINRPKARRGNVFPRAKRWICPETSTENANPHFFGPQFIACRCQLNYVEESQVGLTISHLVTWVPYPEKCYPPAMLPTIKLAKKRIPFRSIETWEYYLGERCLRQLSSPRQVPKDPPQIMHGTGEGQNDVKWKGIPAEDLVDRSLEYPSWFANASIGRILNEKHQPDLIPISQAEYIKMKEDRNALEEECAKLREELYGLKKVTVIPFSLELKKLNLPKVRRISEQALATFSWFLAIYYVPEV
uniref:Aminotransferase-like plant mobile domain-containing protein n=1 Tax=Daucus carota subsp. sativus TaxID=79200 RepID=A0A165YS00_DAUCS